MPATPTRKATSHKTESPAQSLVGCSVAIPSNIFNEGDSQYTGKVVGTPRRRKNAVYVKVDQDDTEYWFPADEVANWVVQDVKPTASAAVPKTPRARKHKHHTDSPQGVSTAGSSQPAEVAGRQHKQAVQSPVKRQENTIPEEVAQRAHDAASCHPENPDAFAETIEDLAATSTDEIITASHSRDSFAWSMVAFAALLAVLVAVVIRHDSTTDWMHQVSHLWRAITRHNQAGFMFE